MSDNEQKLDEIHNDVRQTRTKVEVIDERTSSLNDRIDRVQAQAAENSEDIDDLQHKVSRNSTIIGGAATGISGVLIWLADKVTRLF